MISRTVASRLCLCLLMACTAAATAQPKSAQGRAAQDDPPAAAATAAMGAARSEQVRVLLVANFETTLSSPTTARIIKLNASIGVPFAAGQPLVAFDCEEHQARLKMSQAELTAAQETMDAKVRMQGLEQASAVEVALASAAVNKARGQIQLNEALIGQCTIKAPWAGRVAKVHIKNHMSVTPGLALVDLVKSGPLRLKLNLPSKMLASVQKGAPLRVSIDETGKTYEARVNAVNSRVDPVSQTVEIEAVLAQAYPDLLPGMSGVAQLSTLR
ncbi:efflux RND transporter periplasmic adaptor subunit [Caenimonas sp. SL110]|uniref:efflux RND transporter periplasmic adaptor subunit n=1 Tax=Caenimonas sp. SL110 TaxID=1450524 RepID=UPI0009E3EFF5|nr:HlyD family efflux transporter periplasmic adaptor subunit [Caenimonas sp. SL110]